MTRAEGIAHITETVFENRFMHVQELNRLRAQIKLDGREGNYLMEQRICKGGLIMATDLRASCFSCDCSPLTLVTLAAKGKTIVNRVYHLDRGFERLEEKLARCGAKIQRITV